MIASLIATLAETESQGQTIESIAAHSSIEIGELVDGRRLPMVIDAVDDQQLRQVTRWLQSQGAVEFVDVVFVHLEDNGQPAKHKETT